MGYTLDNQFRQSRWNVNTGLRLVKSGGEGDGRMRFGDNKV